MIKLKESLQSLLILLVSISLVNCDCSVNIRTDLTINSPLIIATDKLYYPNHRTKILLQTLEEISLSCPGKNNLLLSYESKELPKTSFLRLKCTDNDKFILAQDNENEITPSRYSLKNFFCMENPGHILKQISVPSYLPCTDRVYATGFPVRETWFIKVLEICYDIKRNRAIITYSTVSPLQQNKQIKVTDMSPTFKADQVHKDTNSAYIRECQKQHFENVFGAKQSYIVLKESREESVFFERGHLVPRADFVYLSEQEATNYYVNVVPMWNVVNGGNWLKLEKSVRYLTQQYDRDLKVWTGTLGLLELNNKRVFLKSTHRNADKKFAVEVPKFLYKLIYDPTEKKAIVVVVINNPYWVKNNNDVFCDDVIKDVTWLVGLDHDESFRGYTFACTYNNFKLFSTVLPKLPEVQLLV